MSRKAVSVEIPGSKTFLKLLGIDFERICERILKIEFWKGNWKKDFEKEFLEISEKKKKLLECRQKHANAV